MLCISIGEQAEGALAIVLRESEDTGTFCVRLKAIFKSKVIVYY